MRALFVSGGSVGHLAPALAVWKSLQAMAPGAACHFICAQRSDEIDVLTRENIPFSALSLPKHSPIRFVKNMASAWKRMTAFRPEVVFSKGGSLSVPVCLVAWVRGIPIVLHESDAVMGLANSMVARLATTICVGMPQKSMTKTFVLTGNPVRPLVTEGKKEEGLKLTGLSGTRPILLVIGGSQGAQFLNEWVAAHLATLLTHCDVIHITGRGKAGAPHTNGYWSTPYAHDELKHLYACTDLAVSRAGAGAISELAATAIPTILVPLPGLAHDHQTKNARAACGSGGCEVMQQPEVNDHLILRVVALLENTLKRREMSQRMTSLYRPDAARQIAVLVSACVAHP